MKYNTFYVVLVSPDICNDQAKEANYFSNDLNGYSDLEKRYNINTNKYKIAPSITELKLSFTSEKYDYNHIAIDTIIMNEDESFYIRNRLNSISAEINNHTFYIPTSLLVSNNPTYGQIILLGSPNDIKSYIDNDTSLENYIKQLFSKYINAIFNEYTIVYDKPNDIYHIKIH